MGSIIVSKSGGLIYHYDHNVPPRETEKTFSFPLDIKLELEHKRIAVVFGERDGIKIGHSLLAVNGTKVKVENGKALIENDGNDGKDVFEVCSVKIPKNSSFSIEARQGRKWRVGKCPPSFGVLQRLSMWTK